MEFQEIIRYLCNPFMFSCHPLVEYFRDIAGYGQGCSMMTFLSLFGESETVPKY